MNDCYCGDDTPSIYRSARHKARIEHRCYECGVMIQPTETYERVFAVWDGEVDIYKTCARCLSLREFVAAHIPCFCWGHGYMREDAMNEADYWAPETTGLLFGAWRREVLIRRGKRAEYLK